MKKTTILASAVMLALLSGCGGKDAAEHYQDAQTYIAQNKFNAAVIELKSAIQQMPEQAQYRQTLGLLYLQTSDPVSASKELSRAISLGAEAEPIALPLMQALYLSEDYQAVLAGLGDEVVLSDATQNYVKLYQALAETELSGISAAIPIFDTLLLTDQADLKLFAEAALSVNAKHYDNAQSRLVQIAKDSPVYYQALLMNAHLDLLLQQPDKALEKLTSYLEYMPTALKVKLLTAQILVQKGAFDDADTHLVQVLKAVPAHGLTNYLKSVVEYQRQNYQAAKESIDKALQAGQSTFQSRVLAGLISYQLGLEAQALNHFSSVKKQLPAIPEVNKLYVALQLKAGETSEAASSLAQGTLTADDLKLVASTAFQLLRDGDQSAAVDMLGRYQNAVGDNDAEALRLMGNVRLGIAGQEQAGLRDLENALQLDPKQHHTRMVLASSYIRQKQFDKVLQLADEWLADEQTKAAGYNLKAIAYLLKNDADNAGKMLDAADLAEPGNTQTLFMRSAQARMLGQLQRADELLLATLEQKPDFLPALVTYQESQNRQGKPEQGVAVVEKAQREHPDNNEIRLLLAAMYQRQQTFDKVITLLEPIAKQHQELTQNLYTLLTNAYIQTSNRAEALSLSERWYKQFPKNQLAGLMYANMLAYHKQYPQAAKVIDEALALNPNQPAMLKIKMAVAIEQGSYPTAIAAYEKMPKEMQESAEVLFHYGRVQLLNGQITPGINSLTQSYAKVADPITAIALAEAYAKDVSYRKAVNFIEQHFAKHGDTHTGLKFYYANLLLEEDAAKASDVYADIISQHAENFVAQNNYAWALLQAGKVQTALQHAELAVSLNNKHPDILDTYGKVLFALKQYDKANTQFKQSLTLRPDNAEVQINYVKSLIASGNNAAAKEILAKVRTEDAVLQNQVSELQQQLN